MVPWVCVATRALLGGSDGSWYHWTGYGMGQAVQGCTAPLSVSGNDPFWDRRDATFCRAESDLFCKQHFTSSEFLCNFSFSNHSQNSVMISTSSALRWQLKKKKSNHGFEPFFVLFPFTLSALLNCHRLSDAVWGLRTNFPDVFFTDECSSKKICKSISGWEVPGNCTVPDKTCTTDLQQWHHQFFGWLIRITKLCFQTWQIKRNKSCISETVSVCWTKVLCVLVTNNFDRDE